MHENTQTPHPQIHAVSGVFATTSSCFFGNPRFTIYFLLTRHVIVIAAYTRPNTPSAVTTRAIVIIYSFAFPTWTFCAKHQPAVEANLLSFVRLWIDAETPFGVGTQVFGRAALRTLHAMYAGVTLQVVFPLVLFPVVLLALLKSRAFLAGAPHSATIGNRFPLAKGVINRPHSDSSTVFAGAGFLTFTRGQSPIAPIMVNGVTFLFSAALAVAVFLATIFAESPLTPIVTKIFA